MIPPVNRPKHRPIVILIRDGWGSNPHPEWNHANAVHLARTPVDDRLMADYPHVLIRTCGVDVGLPDSVMGNSEVGHQNIGAGRIVEQELMRITGRIRDGSFFENEVLVDTFKSVEVMEMDVHVMGLCSDGRVHSDLEHLYAILEMTKRCGIPGEWVFVHAFMDGRDTGPYAGLGFIEQIEKRCAELGVNPVASVIGRYYAMDRDGRWDRTEKAFRMLYHGEGRQFASAAEAVKHYYDHPSDEHRKGDEFITPSVIMGRRGHPAATYDADAVIFFNFRGDRPRQLAKAFALEKFPFRAADKDGTIRKQGFRRGKRKWRPFKYNKFVNFVTLTAYEEGLPVQVAFEKPAKMEQILGAYAAESGLRQFRCAETEKYAHVTFFFNDYCNDPFPGEERQIVPSQRDISTYDQKPEMSAYEVTDVMVQRIVSGKDDLMVLNYANGDMVGHTGNLQAAVRAVEAVDECVGRVTDAVLARGGGLIVTADHGNCEQMIDPATGGPHTAHTNYDVELIVVDERYRGRRLRSGGRLADIAPTALDMLDLPKPGAMTGTSLILDDKTLF